MIKSLPTLSDVAIEDFNFQGQLFKIPFYMAQNNDVVAYAQDIGKVFYKTDDERKAADNINRVAANYPDVFKGLRVNAYRASTDGKSYKAWAYTKKGVVALGMKVRSEIGTAFVLWASEVMERLLNGETVALQPVSQDPLDMIEASIREIRKNREQAKIAKAIAESNSTRLDALESGVGSQAQEIETIKASRVIRDNELSSLVVGEHMGIYSNSGKIHYQAVVAFAKEWDFVTRGLARIADCPRGDGTIDPQFVITLEGFRVFREEFLSRYGEVESVKVRLGNKNYNIVIKR